MHIRKVQISQIHLGRRFGEQHLGAKLIAGLVLIVSAGATAQAAKAPRPFNHPLLFEPNRGQAAQEVKWLARGPGYQLFFTTDSVSIAVADRAAKAAQNASQTPESLLPRLLLARPAESSVSVFRMKLNGSHAWNAGDGLEPTGSTSNYYIGNDPKQWRTDIPNYARLKEKAVYGGIDMVFHSRGGQLEYDFEVAPGADPQQIRLAFDGLDHMRVDSQTGDLLLTTASGSVARQIRPKIYQQIGEQQVEVAGGYEILDRGQVTFALANYDRRHALVIDPSVVFSVLLAGESTDSVSGIAVDNSGNAYLAGSTFSTRFPVVIGKTDPGLGPHQGSGDAFITKLSPTGTILFSAYFGGTSNDGASAIALDSTGVYITGYTQSKDFPLRGPFEGFPGGAYTGDGYMPSAFVAKISLIGNEYLYSSFLGGSLNDVGTAIAVDGSGAAYVVGFTASTDFPRVGPRPSQLNSASGDAFLTKVAPQGDHLVYSGYLGGNGSDIAYCVAVDQNGVAYVGGQTSSSDLQADPIFPPYPGGYTGFVLIMEPGGTIRDLRYLGGGGKNGDSVNAIALDAYSNVYLGGMTTSSRFPAGPAGFLTIKASPDGIPSGFVVALDAALNPRWGTFWGSYDENAQVNSIALNGHDGEVYFGGSASSPSDPKPSGGFLVKLKPGGGFGESMDYSMRLGASVNGIATFLSPASSGIIPGPHQMVYCTGVQHTDGPTDTTDVFVVKIDEGVRVVSGPHL